MFHRIQQYPLLKAVGQWYRPRAYGDPQSDGRWHGWLIFFPLSGGEAIAPPEPETTQTTFSALRTWSDALTPVYVEVALERALMVAQQPAALISQLAAAEYEALLDAERLGTADEIQRAAADFDEVAAQTAKREADRLRRERLSAESAVAATEEVATYVTAARDEQAAREARERAVKGRAKKKRCQTGRT